MRAVLLDAYGDADVLTVRDTAVPAVQDGKVLVRVHAAGIDRGAIHIMTGRPYLMRLAGLGVRRPKKPGMGSELSGVVEAVGPGVTGFQPGDEVYGVGRSTFAQYAIADAKTLAASRPASPTHRLARSPPPA
jgi:NADPH:quinone reductase-like Zn-dependent oxidoreductase